MFAVSSYTTKLREVNGPWWTEWPRGDIWRAAVRNRLQVKIEPDRPMFHENTESQLLGVSYIVDLFGGVSLGAGEADLTPMTTLFDGHRLCGDGKSGRFSQRGDLPTAPLRERRTLIGGNCKCLRLRHDLL